MKTTKRAYRSGCVREEAIDAGIFSAHSSRVIGPLRTNVSGKRQLFSALHFRQFNGSKTRIVEKVGMRNLWVLIAAARNCFKSQNLIQRPFLFSKWCPITVTLKPPVKTPSAIYPDQNTHGWIANLIQRID